MRAGIPVILFEGGHFPDDYQRFGTRKYYTIALYTALSSIGLLDRKTLATKHILKFLKIKNLILMLFIEM